MSKYRDRLMESVKAEYAINPVATVFAVAMSLSLIVFIIAGLLSHGETIYYIFWKDHNGTFMDFFDSVVFSSDLPYTYWGVIYPPLVTTFYNILGHFMIPFVDPAGGYLGYELRNSQMGLMVYFIATAVSVYLIVFFMRRVLKINSKIKELLILLLIASYPFVYVIERGNIILITLFFCFIFVCGYRSENKTIRYLSYFALAIATGFKIYPLLLGALIIRESRYKEAVACCVMGACMLFLPFLLTDGGPLILLNNIFNYVKIEVPFGFININQLTLTILIPFLSNSTIDIISYIIVAIMYVVTFAIVFFDKEIEFWKLLTMICCCMILGPGVGTSYLFIYLFLPLIFFLNEGGSMSRCKIFYVICFVIIFALLPGFATRWEDTASIVISSLKALFVMLLMSAVVADRIFHHRHKRASMKHEDPDQDVLIESQ